MGGWKQANPIPAEYPSWNTFLELHELNQARVRALVESLGADPAGGGDEAAAGAAANPNHQKLTDFWRSANDEAAIEARGIAPLVEPLKLAKAVCAAPPGSAARATALGQFMSVVGTSALFCVGESADSKESTKTRCSLSQAGLGLPDRDYYFDGDKAVKQGDAQKERGRERERASTRRFNFLFYNTNLRQRTCVRVCACVRFPH